MNKELKEIIESITGKNYKEDSEQEMAEDLEERTEHWNDITIKYHDIVSELKKNNQEWKDKIEKAMPESPIDLEVIQTDISSLINRLIELKETKQ